MRTPLITSSHIWPHSRVNSVAPGRSVLLCCHFHCSEVTWALRPLRFPACFFNHLFMFTTRRTSKARHCWPFVRGILQWYVINIISKFIFDYYSHNPIRSSSSAVVPCINLWPDRMIIFQVHVPLTYLVFLEIWLWCRFKKWPRLMPNITHFKSYNHL